MNADQDDEAPPEAPAYRLYAQPAIPMLGSPPGGDPEQVYEEDVEPQPGLFEVSELLGSNDGSEPPRGGKPTKTGGNGGGDGAGDDDGAGGDDTGEIYEDVEPKPGTWKWTNYDRGDDAMRRWFAGGLLVLLAILVLAASYGWLFGGKDHTEIQTFTLIMAPVVTMTGTILGFYFSQRR